MTAAELLDDLRAAGARLAVSDGLLRVQAPPGVLDDDLRAALATHRDAIVRALSPAWVRPWTADEFDRIAWTLEADDRRRLAES